MKKAVFFAAPTALGLHPLRAHHVNQHCMDMVPTATLFVRSVPGSGTSCDGQIAFVCPVVILVKFLDVFLKLHQTSLNLGKNQAVAVIIAVAVFIPANHCFAFEVKNP